VICPTRQTAERFNVSHSVIVRLKQRVNQTRSVKERQRTERSLKMTPREDRLLKRFARQQPFLAVLWRIVSSRRFIGLLARNLALLRCLLTVRLLMRPLTIHWLCSVFIVLNGCMTRRKPSDAERWQAIGMVRGDMSYKTDC
jgi:hypothetical protein